MDMTHVGGHFIHINSINIGQAKDVKKEKVRKILILKDEGAMSYGNRRYNDEDEIQLTSLNSGKIEEKNIPKQPEMKLVKAYRNNFGHFRIRHI